MTMREVIIRNFLIVDFGYYNGSYNCSNKWLCWSFHQFVSVFEFHNYFLESTLLTIESSLHKRGKFHNLKPRFLRFYDSLSIRSIIVVNDDLHRINFNVWIELFPIFPRISTGSFLILTANVFYRSFLNDPIEHTKILGEKMSGLTWKSRKVYFENSDKVINGTNIDRSGQSVNSSLGNLSRAQGEI